MADDPLTASLQTLDRMAGDDAEFVADQEIEYFLLRTGRPLPRVVVVGRDLATRCRQVERLGGDPVGVGGSSAVQFARTNYPGGTFMEGDIRDLPVERNAFDGAWLGGLISLIPKGTAGGVLASLHAALRPGGLLYARPEQAGDPRFTRWSTAELATELGVLDFSLVENRDGALIFRREY